MKIIHINIVASKKCNYNRDSTHQNCCSHELYLCFEFNIDIVHIRGFTILRG